MHKDSFLLCLGPISKLVACAVMLVSSVQPVANESVHDELVRLQEQDGLTLAWTDSRALLISYRGLANADDPFRAILFRRRMVIPLKDSLPALQPTGFKFSDIPRLATIDLCWSHDQTKLAATMFHPDGASLGIIDLRTKATQTFDSQAGQVMHFTSQCWSPDDKQVAYEVERSVKVYTLGADSSSVRVLAEGTDVTWSPDGNWISFRDHNTYYAIHPDGSGRKKLFEKTSAVSALYWSPDSRIVAYVRERGFLQGGALDAEVNQLRVRRLEDGSEDRLCPDSVDWYANYQWVKSPAFVKNSEPSSPARN
jgi:WD40-like Beta Propeller Repeat